MSIQVVRLASGDFQFNAKLSGKEARKIDIVLRQNGYEIEQLDEEEYQKSQLDPEVLENINSFYGD